MAELQVVGLLVGFLFVLWVVLRVVFGKGD